jgi:hypothetical protein
MQMASSHRMKGVNQCQCIARIQQDARESCQEHEEYRDDDAIFDQPGVFSAWHTMPSVIEAERHLDSPGKDLIRNASYSG